MADELLEQIKADLESGTPGPWFFQKDFSNAFALSNGESGETIHIAKANSEQVNGGYGEAEANASRIARVPDLEARILRDADTIRELVAALIAVEKSTDTRRQGAIATTALIAFHAKQEAR